MDIEKLVRVWRSQWEAAMGGEGVIPFFAVKNEF